MDTTRPREETCAEIAARYRPVAACTGAARRTSFSIGLVLGAIFTLLAVLAIFTLACGPRETPVATSSKPATQVTETSDWVSTVEQITAEEARAYESVQPNVQPLTMDELSTMRAAGGTARTLKLAPSRMVSFASPAVPLQVFRVDDEPPMTVDRYTYRRPRYAFVAIDIADMMRSENTCLFAVWQRELSIGSCYWPASFGRGKWMVIPIDTSPVVEFRRLTGPSIIPAVRIADLRPISAGELR